MKTQKTLIKLITLLVGTALIVSAPLNHADAKDTPDDVMTAAKNTSNKISPALLVLQEADAVMKKMSEDRKYAELVLQAANKKDNKALVALFKKYAPNSEIKILETSDFTVKVSFTVGSAKVDLCGSSSKGCAGGSSATASLTV